MYPPPPSDSSPPAPEGGSSLSALAVSALVVALVPCCPLTALIGAFLGLFAMRRIQRSGGRLRGNGIAMAAMVAGAVGAIVWAIAFERFALAQQDAQETAIAEQIGGILIAAQEGRPADVLAGWYPDATTPTAEEIIEFGAEVTTRYGDVDRFAVLSAVRSGPLMSPEIVVAGIYRSASEEPIGSARFRMILGVQLTPTFKPMQIVIEDPDRGDLVLGRP